LVPTGKSVEIDELLHQEGSEAAKGKAAKQVTTPPPASLGEAALSDEVKISAPAAVDSSTIAGFRSEIIMADSALRVRGGHADRDVVQMVTAERPILVESTIPAAQSTPYEIAYSELEFDSLVNLYSVQGTSEGDSLAAEFAYRRALAIPRADYIEEAKERVQTQLDRAETPDARHYYSIQLERLSQLKVAPKP
jgi:hypothetical protein